MKSVYLDNNATTMVDPKVKALMEPFFCEYYGNPNSLHKFGTQTHRAIHEAIEELYKGINASDEDDIIITSCATESNNWVLKGVYFDLIHNGDKKHIVTTEVEHPAVGATCSFLESLGVRITRLPINSNGNISLEQVREALCEDTALVSIMWANNETGLIFPIEEIGALCRERGILFHTDAVQAFAHVPINVDECNIDMLSASGHKLNGPKGIGVLFCRRGLRLLPFIDGGAQERGRRAGTENIAEIVSMAAALKEACANMQANSAKLIKMRDRIISELVKIPHSKLNGDMAHHLPGTINMCFEGIEGEGLLLLLDDKGICASSGSACTSGSLDPSHVLLAIGLPHEVAHGSLRLSLSEYNTEEDADRIIKAVPEVVEYLRNMSPVWKELERGEKPHLL